MDSAYEKELREDDGCFPTRTRMTTLSQVCELQMMSVPQVYAAGPYSHVQRCANGIRGGWMHHARFVERVFSQLVEGGP